jgi:hypothetical protein
MSSWQAADRENIVKKIIYRHDSFLDWYNDERTVNKGELP